MVKTVIFDFDMTLVNSIYAITKGLNQMAEHFSLPRVTEDDTRKVMSLPSSEFWSALWGEHNPAWSEYFLAAVKGDEKHYLEIVPGAVELLAGLKNNGTALGLATNRDDAWAALSSVDLARFFDAAVGAGDVEKPKPHPDMVLKVMHQVGADPGQTILIGDAVYDVQAANAAGIKAIAVLEGGVPRTELLAAGAWQLVDTLKDAGDILNRL